ncbi:hypothetical protein [Roseococcus sp. YIM B11640]|uniref:hypothetical protein n=1 Tax=Roseococcus sp. YIM B11640 TaxID=3133973 RepID=UPI003C7C5E9A
MRNKKTLTLAAAALALLGVGFGGGAAWSQAPVFAPFGTNRGGLPSNNLFTVVCTTAGGTYDSSRRMVVMRPQGNQNSADVTLQCQNR